MCVREREREGGGGGEQRNGGRGLFEWRNAASGARTWAVGGVCGRGV